MTCTYCGTDLPEEAMFCGECGRSVAPRPVVAVPDVAVPAVTVSSVPASLVEIVLDEPESEPPSNERVASINDLFFEPGEGPEEPGPEPEPEPVVMAPAVVAAEELVDLEQTRLTGPSQSGERFVLQFSTGESVTVFGTGIIGRNPTPEPSEYFDQRVTIFDPTKSVSKTHLEFGQTAGAFWINDRFSGNGTGIRQPDSHRVSCEPGKRYLLARGTRVDIGEQFFIVS